MSRALHVVWWIGLLGALVATVAILKEVALVLRALSDIHRLAEITGDAAEGIAANVRAVSRLPELGEPAGRLREASNALKRTAASLEQTVETLTAASRPRGG